jgi:hypothetical protein
LQQHAEQPRLVVAALASTAHDEGEKSVTWVSGGGALGCAPPAPLRPPPTTARLETPYYARRQSVSKAVDTCLLM